MNHLAIVLELNDEQMHARLKTNIQKHWSMAHLFKAQPYCCWFPPIKISMQSCDELLISYAVPIYSRNCSSLTCFPAQSRTLSSALAQTTIMYVALMLYHIPL
jgi:hypothetical protein